MPETWSLVDAAVRGCVLALLLVLAGVLLRERPGLVAVRIASLLLAGLAVQVLGSAPAFEAQAPRLWQAPLVAVAVGNAVLFALFVLALFDDEFRLRPRHALAWGAAALLGYINCACVFGSASVLTAPLLALQRAVPLLAVAVAVWAVARHWQADLVEPRRRLRMFIVVGGAAYTLLQLSLRLGSGGGRLSSGAATLDILLLLALCIGIAAPLLRLGATGLFPVPKDSCAPAATAAPPPPPDPAEERLAGTLQRLMADERAYLDEGLTVASLAARLAVPEYRLRRLINGRLGHRNFNAFVNGWRLQAAQAALADPARRELPVLSIALDAGFQSIGPFNRAFKAATGLTPTEFRRDKLADS